MNNIVGGWGVINGGDWLTYASKGTIQGALGLGTLGDTTSGFANYDFIGANVFTGYTASGTANARSARFPFLPTTSSPCITSGNRYS